MVHALPSGMSNPWGDSGMLMSFIDEIDLMRFMRAFPSPVPAPTASYWGTPSPLKEVWLNRLQEYVGCCVYKDGQGLPRGMTHSPVHACV